MACWHQDLHDGAGFTTGTKQAFEREEAIEKRVLPNWQPPGGCPKNSEGHIVTLGTGAEPSLDC
jgi:hypothetical protein